MYKKQNVSNNRPGALFQVVQFVFSGLKLADQV